MTLASFEGEVTEELIDSTGIDGEVAEGEFDFGIGEGPPEHPSSPAEFEDDAEASENDENNGHSQVPSKSSVDTENAFEARS